jgi:prepilin-type N-terminal cleavage/methylation domain-containing protein
VTRTNGRPGAGFTLLEMMVVLALVGVITALVSVDMGSLAGGIQDQVAGEQVATYLDGVRRRAHSSGRCWRVRLVSGELRAQQRGSGDCVSDPGGGTWVDAAGAPRLAPEQGYTFSLDALPAAPAAPNNLIFRPSGRLRGDGDLALAEEEARVVVAHRRGTHRVVTVTGTGRMCVGASLRSVPTLSTPLGCP